MADPKPFLRAFLTGHLNLMPQAEGSGLELFHKPVWVLAETCPDMTLREAARYLRELAESVLAERLNK